MEGYNFARATSTWRKLSRLSKEPQLSWPYEINIRSKTNWGFFNIGAQAIRFPGRGSGVSSPRLRGPIYAFSVKKVLSDKQTTRYARLEETSLGFPSDGRVVFQSFHRPGGWKHRPRWGSIPHSYTLPRKHATHRISKNDNAQHSSNQLPVAVDNQNAKDANNTCIYSKKNTRARLRHKHFSQSQFRNSQKSGGRGKIRLTQGWSIKKCPPNRANLQHNLKPAEVYLLLFFFWKKKRMSIKTLTKIKYRRMERFFISIQWLLHSLAILRIAVSPSKNKH